MKMLRNARLRLNKTELNIMIIALVYGPAIALADWQQTLQQYGTDIRIALYAFAGTIAVCGVVWSGIKWLFARMAGDRSHTFMDYLQEVLVVIAVGGAVALATAAWQVFGTSSSGSGTTMA